jgi:hypothetical protein
VTAIWFGESPLGVARRGLFALLAAVLQRAEPKPYDRIAATPLEDQVGRPCAACERDGQHEPGCAVHEDPAAECTCERSN